MKTQFPIVFAATLAIAPLAAQVATETAPASRPAVQVAQLDHASPNAMLASLKEHMKAGRMTALWAGVSPVDRSEIHGIVMSVTKNVEPGVYDAVMGVVTKLGPILKNNATYMANNPMMSGGKEPAEVEATVKNMCGVLTKLQESPLASHAKVSKMTEADFGQFFASMGGDLSTMMTDPGMAGDLPDFNKVTIGEAVIDGNKATVRVTMEGEEDDEELSLRQVDGKWYFDMAEPISEMREQVGDMEKMTPQESMQIKGLINGMISPMLKNFEDVESQEDFDDAVQKSFGLFMGLMGGGMGGGGFGR